MQILVNSDHHISGGESIGERVQTIVAGAVDRFASRITRVEVHLSDVNGPKHGARSKRCLMEARVANIRPVAVSHEAPILIEAIDGAVAKLERALDHAMGKLDQAGDRSPPEKDIASLEMLEELERH